MRHLDLFSGIGGFALAARWAGIETVAFCEIDEFCQKVLEKNFPNIPIIPDIKKFGNFRNVDLLTAGFPCQPFSIAGKKKGINDDRYLWPHVRRIIGESKPNWIILENVYGIIPYLDPILNDLERENYAFESFIIPACAVGAPHKRERVWIIAHTNGERCLSRSDNWKERQIQNDWQRYIKAIHEEWPKFITQSWKIMQNNEWLTANAGFSRINDGLSNRVDRIKSLGNSVVPQIPFLFMKMIKIISKSY